MAAQNEEALTTTKEQQGRQQQGSSGTASLARRLRAPDTALLLNPFDLFGFSPFGMMRRMTRELERSAADLGLMGGDAGWSPAVEVSESNGKVLILVGWPSSSLWALGTLVGVSLLFSGVARLTLPMVRPRPAIAGWGGRDRPSLPRFQQQNRFHRSSVHMDTRRWLPQKSDSFCV